MTGRTIAMVLAAGNAVASVGYFIQGDIRRGLYYFLAAAITVTVSY